MREIAGSFIFVSVFSLVTLQKKNVVYIFLYCLIVFLFCILKDTPLIEAARCGHTYIVRLLLENGAAVNKRRLVR